jgi:cytochrome P450
VSGWKTDFRTNYQFDAAELSEHYDEIIDDLHASGCAVARSEVGEGYYVINRDEDVRRCARDWQTFSSADGFMPNRPTDAPLFYPVECDPPLHSQLRAALNPHLSPRVITSYEPRIRAHAGALIDAFIDSGSADIVAQYSNQLPALVFCEVVAGMPLEDLPWLQREEHIALYGPAEERGAAFTAVQNYMDAYLRKRKESPRRGDIVDAILEADIEGYRWKDRTGTLSQLTLAGIGTTGYVIAAGIDYLARNRKPRAALGQESAIDHRVVEEFLRVFSAAKHDGRRVMKDVDVSGTRLVKGDFVLLGFGAACRDPEVFTNPAEIDLHRFPNPHVAFGTGIHRCVGSHLARALIRIALEEFLVRIPSFEVRQGFKPAYDTGFTRSMMSLVIDFR